MHSYTAHRWSCSRAADIWCSGFPRMGRRLLVPLSVPIHVETGPLTPTRTASHAKRFPSRKSILKAGKHSKFQTDPTHHSHPEIRADLVCTLVKSGQEVFVKVVCLVKKPLHGIKHVLAGARNPNRARCHWETKHALAPLQTISGLEGRFGYRLRYRRPQLP